MKAKVVQYMITLTLDHDQDGEPIREELEQAMDDICENYNVIDSYIDHHSEMETEIDVG